MLYGKIGINNFWYDLQKSFETGYNNAESFSYHNIYIEEFNPPEH